MTITKQIPRTIHLSGALVTVDTLAGSGVITPGYLIERFNSSGTPKFRAHSTAGGKGTKTVAINRSMLNKGVDDNYADGDLLEAGILLPGSVGWLLLASGENVVAGDFLESNGNGTVRKFGSGTALFQVTEAVNNTGLLVPARIKAEAI